MTELQYIETKVILILKRGAFWGESTFGLPKDRTSLRYIALFSWPWRGEP